MLRLLLIPVLVFVMTDPAGAADKRPMTFDDLMAFKRVADPQISPDGSQVVYEVSEILEVASNKRQTHLWLAATDGKTSPRQLTSSGKRDAHVRWHPDGTKLLFESTRGATPQLYVLDLKAGGEARKITDIATGAGTGIWSPDGSNIAFVSAVYPEFSELPFTESNKKNKEKEDAIEASPVKAKTFTRLFYRHWDDYVGDKRQHLFVCTADGADCRDVTPGDRDAYPTSTTFSVGDDFVFSPDGKFLVFTAVPAKGEAWSTNHDICRVSLDNKSKEWETLTKDNLAADNSPRFSPDGKKLAWRAQKRPGNEADKWQLMVTNCKPDGSLVRPGWSQTDAADFSVDEIVWPGNSATILLTFDQEATSTLFLVEVRGPEDAVPVVEVYKNQGQIGSVTVAADGKTLVCTQTRMNHPAEVAVSPLRKLNLALRPLSHANDALLAKLDLPRPESVNVPVEGGVKMQMWILKPPGFDPAKRWPVVYIVHGGPQVPFNDNWSFRWNAELWAAQGYVIAMPNFRGSPGWGQKYVDEISGDWGGKAYRDCVSGLEYMKKQPYVDASRMAAAGASFGGYMMNWFAVNDIAKDFKCLVTHCSVWNFESMWGTTDELWFDEGEHGGLPWEVPGKYREFSPHTKAANLGKNKVPTLVIQNDKDYRCPIGQGHELFTALQRQGVPSRFVNFPDEGHWVTKPANSKHWHKEVFDWLKTYAPPGGKDR